MRKAIFVAILVLGAAACWAGTTGKLTGTVADDKGLALPGVTITIESPALIGGPRTLATEADGSFSFPAIAPGVYTIKASLQGFVTQERNQVEVRLDHTTTLQITIPQARFGEEVRVVAETPVVDRAQASAGQTFTAGYLQQAAISSNNRSYEAVLSQAAGVAGGALGTNVFGSTYAENAYFIDGLDSTDPATGTPGTNLNFDVIDEISFQTGGFEAEYGRATGGVVNLITKSGGNTFSGTLDVRYRNTSFNENGDHFNKNEQTVSFVKPAVTLGGPVLRDKIWFFVGYEQVDNKTTPSGSPTTSDQAGQNWLAKITWQPDANWRIVAKTTGNPNHMDNANASPFVLPAAAAHSKGDATVNQLETQATITPNLLWSLQLGINHDVVDYYPQSGDLTTPGHVDLATQIDSVNYFNAQYSTRDRNAVRTSLMYLVDQFGGSHEFKGGLEYDQTKFDFHSFLPGGFVYGDLVGNPYVLLYATDSGTQHYKGHVSGAYLQDAWRPTPRLTLKLGVRWDEAAYDDASSKQIADLSLIQPRLGAAWDITGDGKTVARASFGRFMHPGDLTLPLQTLGSVGSLGQYVSCTHFFGSRAVCEGYAASIGTIVINDPSGFYPGEGWMLTKPYAPVSEHFASNLKPTYADEWVLGIEREFAKRTSIGLDYVHKDTKDIIENTCNGNWPGPPSAGAPCAYLITANLPGLERNYRGWVLRVESRATDWLHILASYTYSSSKGNIEDTQYNATDFDVYPYLYENRYGYLSDDRRNRLKINGYAQLPYEFTVGLSAYFESAFRWTPLDNANPNLPGSDVYVAPRGSRVGYSDPEIDLQVSKRFPIGGIHVELIASVLNVLSSQKPTAVCQYLSGCGTATLGQAIAWQQPRHYEAGFRIEF
jgi:hypothetical protein